MARPVRGPCAGWNVDSELEPSVPVAGIFFVEGGGGLEPFCVEGRARTTIGRGSDCDLVLADPRASRLHASIELLDGQFLLRDEGSANGTFLNGLRLTAAHVFSLREGDAIEIGSTMLRFGQEVGPSAPPEDTPLGDTGGFALADLLLDGTARLDLPRRRAIQVSVHRAFEGVQRAAGFERFLELLRADVSFDAAGVFLAGTEGVRAVAGSPGFERTTRLLEIAARAASTGEGRLAVGAAGQAGASLEETCVTAQTSAAASPCAHGGVRGVVVVERVRGRRLDRTDLALLSVFANRLAQTLGLQGNVHDTRTGRAV